MKFLKIVRDYTGVLWDLGCSGNDGLTVGEVVLKFLWRTQFLHLQIIRDISLYGRVSFSLIHLSLITVDPEII